MKKILVVDDDKDLLLLIKSLLKKTYDTLVFDNAHEGTENMLTFAPDLVVLDVNIGKQDGRDICRSMKHDDQLKGIPVILISGDSAMLKNSAECAADAVLQKPFAPAQLLSAIASHIN